MSGSQKKSSLETEAANVYSYQSGILAGLASFDKWLLCTTKTVSLVLRKNAINV